MTMPRTRLLVLLVGGLMAAVAMALPAGSPARADARSDTTLFVNLTTDDPWSATMAFGYADMVRKAGHPVVVFLNVRAVRLADRTRPPETPAPDGKGPRALLEGLIANGVTVYVCPMCSEKAGLAEADWIAGVKRGGPETIKVQMAPATKVMSY
ncbi:MAG: DsrE family protein [Rhodospirillales bacterium]